MQEEEDGDGGASVVIGILSFESLRQGALAVSSLLLTDETGARAFLITLVPSPSETWFRGMSVGGSFRRE